MHNPFKYLLTYKFSQDHIELLFSCICSRGEWNNNPNCLKFKYAIRKMLMRYAITASKNANCVDFTGCNSIIPLFHTSKKSKTPDVENTEQTTASENDSLDNSPELNFMCSHLDKEHSEFTANVLFYIAGYIVTQLIDKLPCPSCKMSLIPVPDKANSTCQHGCTSSRYHEVGKASAFTLFVNKGGLKIPSTSVFHTIEYCEHVFKAMDYIKKHVKEFMKSN